MGKGGFVYILASRRNGTLCVGVTANLVARIAQHRTGAIRGFTDRYGIKRLVYVEAHDEIESAIARAKNLKRWRRQWKLDLIERTNPYWRDLWTEIIGAPTGLTEWSVSEPMSKPTNAAKPKPVDPGSSAGMTL